MPDAFSSFLAQGGTVCTVNDKKLEKGVIFGIFPNDVERYDQFGGGEKRKKIRGSAKKKVWKRRECCQVDPCCDNYSSRTHDVLLLSWVKALWNLFRLYPRCPHPLHIISNLSIQQLRCMCHFLPALMCFSCSPSEKDQSFYHVHRAANWSQISFWFSTIFTAEDESLSFCRASFPFHCSHLRHISVEQIV